MVLVKSLELLFDGKIKVIFFGDGSTYLQPPIVVNSYLETSLVRAVGQPAVFVNIDTTLEEVDGVAFSGTFDDLDLAIRTIAKDSNAIWFGSNVGGNGDATAANQETTNGYLIKKNIGKTLDLTTSSGDPIAYPFTLDSIEINGTAITPSPAISQQITNSKDLVGVLAIIQDLYLFSVIDANNLLLNSGSLPLSELVQFKIFANSGAQTFTYSAFADSSDSALSSEQQVLERLKELQATIIKANDLLKLQAKLTDTQPISIQTGAVGSMLQEIQTTGLWRGKIAKAYNLIGQRNGFTSNSIMNDVKEYDNGVANVAITANSTLDIISSSASDSAAGTGARTVKVTYINSSNNLVESAAIALNGNTLVTSVLTGVNQVLWMETATAGSGGVAAGNIRLRINGGVVEVEQITAGCNKSRSAIFMIPTGYTGYVASWRVSAVQNDQDVRLRGTVNTLDSSLSTLYHYMSQKYAANNTSIPMHDIWLKVPALARVKASTVSAGTAATVRCNVNILIVIIQD